MLKQKLCRTRDGNVTFHTSVASAPKLQKLRARTRYLEHHMAVHAAIVGHTWHRKGYHQVWITTR